MAKLTSTATIGRKDKNRKSIKRAVNHFITVEGSGEEGAKEKNFLANQKCSFKKPILINRVHPGIV